jgi:hypothetical protein
MEERERRLREEWEPYGRGSLGCEGPSAAAPRSELPQRIPVYRATGGRQD